MRLKRPYDWRVHKFISACAALARESYGLIRQRFAMEETADSQLVQKFSASEKQRNHFQNFAIGKDVHAITQELMAAGERLSYVLDRPDNFYVNDLLSELEHQACRVAVIGQVNAGKSSFINALVQRPSLLPTGVQPWTAVPTLLNFGTQQGKEGSALFHFFGPDEWDRLFSDQEQEAHTPNPYNGNQNGFHKELTALHDRAKKSLGNRYNELLGKHHLFKSVTPEIVESYIAAGPSETRTAGQGNRGRFSDITKSAELFFEKEPFYNPMVILDTPGVDHPNLASAEITWENIGEADIYILVLMAQRGLTQSDISLVRSLYKLQEERVIVAVNCIDRLNDVSQGAESITADIRAQLDNEFPGVFFPVIPTSALWGMEAVGNADIDINTLLSPDFFAYSERFGTVEAGEIGSFGISGFVDQQRMAQLLYDCSGFPKVAQEIDRLMRGASCTNSIHESAVNLLTVAKIAVTLHAYKKNGLLKLMEKHGGGKEDSHSSLHILEQDLNILQAQFENMKHVLENNEMEMHHVIDKGLEYLSKRLSQDLAEFALQQWTTVSTLRVGEEPGTASSRVPAMLQNQIAEAIIAEYRDLKAQLLSAEQEARKMLLQNAREMTSRGASEFGEDLFVLEERLPVFAPVTEMVDFDLEALSDGLNKAQHKANWTSEKIQRIFRKELSSSVKKMLKSARDDLERDVSNYTKTLKTIVEMLGNKFITILHNRINFYKAHIGNSEQRISKDISDILASQLAKAKDSFSESYSIATDLQLIYKRAKQLKLDKRPQKSNNE